VEISIKFIWTAF